MDEYKHNADPTTSTHLPYFLAIPKSQTTTLPVLPWWHIKFSDERTAKSLAHINYRIGYWTFSDLYGCTTSHACGQQHLKFVPSKLWTDCPHLTNTIHKRIRFESFKWCTRDDRILPLPRWTVATWSPCNAWDHSPGTPWPWRPCQWRSQRPSPSLERYWGAEEPKGCLSREGQWLENLPFTQQLRTYYPSADNNIYTYGRIPLPVLASVLSNLICFNATISPVWMSCARYTTP